MIYRRVRENLLCDEWGCKTIDKPPRLLCRQQPGILSRADRPSSGKGGRIQSQLPVPAMKICPYTIDRYDDVMAMMHRTSGVSIRDADSRPATERYLARNPGMSFLCVDAERVVGCAMCGHDGRRGYLQHVIVDEAYRGRGIAHELVEHCLAELGKIGIEKTHLDVFVDNDLGNRYWTRRGWQQRHDIYRYSLNRSDRENA
jgi:ribosomal protein S18 acetylase RimI-like enzyme